ncbi:MAG: hypothetical protein ACTMHT_02705 [Oceanisphaera sp.]
MPRYNAASNLPIGHLMETIYLHQGRLYQYSRKQPRLFYINHKVSTTVLKNIEVEECKFQ